MKSVNQASDKIPSGRRTLGSPRVLVLIGVLTSACVGTPTAHDNLGRGFAKGSSDLTYASNIGSANEVQREASAESEEKRNKLSLFLGVTHKASESGGSVGLKYERRLSDLFGIGLLFESTRSLDERVVGAPVLYLHPVGDLGVLLAPGVEDADGETVFLFRVGLSWDFELGGGFTLAPEVNYDFVEGSDDAVIYGFAVAYGF